MRDYIFAEAAASALRKDVKRDFSVQTTCSPQEIVQYCRITAPYALLTLVMLLPLIRHKHDGIGGSLFGPDNDCARGQIAALLYRVYGK